MYVRSVSVCKFRSSEKGTDLLGGLTHKHEALSVGDDLGSVESLLEVIDELLLVALEWLALRTSNDAAGTDTLFLDGRQATREDGLTDESD